MEFFKVNTQINRFHGAAQMGSHLPIVIFIASIISLVVNKLNLGLDFTGGTQIVLTYEQAVDLNKVREQLAQAGLGQPIVQSYGTSRDVLIRIAPHKEFTEQMLREKIMQALPGAKLQQMDFIGAQAW